MTDQNAVIKTDSTTDTDKHDCHAGVSSLAALSTSLMMCAESKAWKCQSKHKTLIITVISIVWAALTHLLQCYKKDDIHWMLKHFLYAVSFMFPQICFGIADLGWGKCDKDDPPGKSKYEKSDWARILALVFTPMVVYTLSVAPYVHTLVCESMTKHEKASGKAAGKAAANKSALPGLDWEAMQKKKHLQNPSPYDHRAYTPPRTQAAPAQAAPQPAAPRGGLTNHKTTYIPSVHSNQKVSEVNRLTGGGRRRLGR